MIVPNDDVIRIAQEAHSAIWRMSGDEGTGDKLAAQVTARWQSEVQRQMSGTRFIPEYRIADNLRERIDLVDVQEGMAYELKVSPNNDHFEYYRDIFKVFVAREHLLPNLRGFCFLCPAVAQAKYSRGLRREVLGLGKRLDLALYVRQL